MPAEAELFVFVASRRLSEPEQAEVRAAADAWLQEWHAFYSTCPTSFSRTLVDGWALVWAVDDRSRRQPGLTGSDLDPLYERLEGFAAGGVSPVKIIPNYALIVGGEVIPMGPIWWDLAHEGRISADTPVLGHCRISDWRAGRFIRRLGDEPWLMSALFGRDEG